MVPIDKLEQIKQRFEFLEAKMNDGAAGEDIAKLAKEYSELRPVVEQIDEYQTLLSDLEEAKLMLDDPDMKDLAAEELPTIKDAHSRGRTYVAIGPVAQGRSRCASRYVGNSPRHRWRRGRIVCR